MKFNSEKKQSIMLYLLEKIAEKNESVAKTVSDNFSINLNTVHTYINELVKKNIIKRVKRGEYELVNTRHKYKLKRSKGELNNDTDAFLNCLKPHIEHLPTNVKSAWGYSFTEIINNAMDHSQAEEVTIIVETNYLMTRTWIADNGIGIFKKIAEHFKYNSLDEAICELFKGKLTTDSKNHSGEGIFFSSKLMDNFFIVSSGKIFTSNRYDNSNIIDMESLNTNGTCVFMSLSNFSHKKPDEIFDLYANEDGGFVKTKIPLKNIFDADPVSRSQAKRISNRLERFKEVILDFEDIQWIGQGFAHQLFVVFKNEHPDISLLPVNMNESVTKMYHHVTSNDM